MWSWNILLFEEILHYAALRSEWHGSVFLLTIRNLNYFWNAKIFYYSYIIKEAKLAKFIRFEAMWWRMKDEGWRMKDEGCGVRSAGCKYSITKFSEMWWNDGVFEGSEEHRRCSGKVTNFRLADVEKLFPWWRDSSLLYASFRMTWFCFLLTIRNLNYFWNAKIFYYSYVFKEAK